MKTSGVAPRDHPPFANSDDGYAWQSNWCDRCIHDQPAREGRYEDACGIWYIAECGQTPGEWLRQPGQRYGDQYHCIEFRSEDDGPEPTPPGQGELLPMEPYLGVKMFADVAAEVATVSTTS